MLKAKYGKVFLYVERGDKAYVVTDGDTLDRVRHILLQQTQLGQQQAALSQQQEALSRQQETLSKKQEALGATQEALQKESDAQIDTVLDQAIREGLAKQVH